MIYNSMTMAKIISADEIKKTFPKYSPAQAEVFHHVSARQADREFENAIKKDQHKKGSKKEYK